MKKRVLQMLLVAIMLFALLVSCLVSCKKDGDGDVTPETSAPVADNEVVEDDSEDSTEQDKINLNAPDDGGSAGLSYKKSVRIDLSDEKVTLYFANTASSTHNVTVQLVAEGKVLAESGVLTPGDKITKLTLKDGVTISKGVYDTGAKLVVNYYDPQTNVCATVNSEFNITLTVVV